MNIETRKDILKFSLVIENLLSDILMNIMGIKDSENKSLSHKTSALSFKAKTDLLFDLEKVDKELYDKLIMFMEIRNQFIHNLSSDSYEIVLERVKKKNHILKLDSKLEEISKTINDPEKKEELYKLAFATLAFDVIDKLDKLRVKILKDKIDELEIQKKAIASESYMEVLEVLGNAIDEYADFFNDHMQKSFESKMDFGENIRYGIRAIFEKKMKEKRNNES